MRKRLAREYNQKTLNTTMYNLLIEKIPYGPFVSEAKKKNRGQTPQEWEIHRSVGQEFE